MTISELYVALEQAKQAVNTAAGTLTALCPPGSAEAHAAADLRKALSHIDRAQSRLSHGRPRHDKAK